MIHFLFALCVSWLVVGLVLVVFFLEIAPEEYFCLEIKKVRNSKELTEG